MIGKTLAHYEVTAKLGEGGMGEVYRARDTKLDRDVALKILPREMSGDRERVARFEREARTLAGLQHPNIASIYGYEDVDGVRFLAMELVEGQDLAERLEQGAISTDEALTIALQIATGLEAAHERNIVHRDLKPANVKVDPDGVVKILDFGLARAYTGDPEDQSNPAMSPTITAAMTMAGTILGTAAYMSPEQARGRNVDKRSDIWAFGVMVFEMLTGKRLYDGETVTDILGAIVHSNPDLELLPSSVPASVKRMLGRCLTSDVQERLRDIGEARIVLSDPGAPGSTPAKLETSSSGRGWMFASVALGIVAIAVAAMWLTAEPLAPPVIHSSVMLPEGQTIIATGLRGGSPRVSPDGQSIAFVAQGEGVQQIWIRRLAERQAVPLPGTEGAHRPFWSPDSRSIGFFSESNMRRVAVSGGAPLTIAPASSGRGGAWLDNGEIVFAPTPNSPLFVVPASGGAPRQVTDPGLRSHREPRRLPREDHFLFLDNVGGGEWKMWVGNLLGEPPVEVGRSFAGAEFADGRLLYLQGRTLVAHPFDLDSFSLYGDPTPLAERVIRDPNFGIGVFSVAEGGVLCYQAGSITGGRLNWVNRAGIVTGTLSERAEYEEFALSRNGELIAATINDSDGRSDIWIIDAERGTQRRFTFTPEGSRIRRAEVKWSPDSEFVVYSVETDSGTALGKKFTDGASDEETLLAIPGVNVWPYDVGPQGKWVLFGKQDGAGNEDLWIVDSNGEGEPRPLFETPFDEWPGTISPDGQWLAFDSNETGRREIFVTPFPDGGGRWQVSRGGGRFPRWSHDGSELYYANLHGSLMVVDVEDTTTETIFEALEPTQLFSPGVSSGIYSGTYGSYGLDPSGERFLLLEVASQGATLSLFQNWARAIEDR